ncbi:hypothetical protein Btru_047251 [Bulinus truncatus]|nr:hypothetical protein Btru_047251 [Bulinus truncatus]
MPHLLDTPSPGWTLRSAKYGHNMDISEPTLKRWLLETNNNVIHAAALIQRHESVKWKLGLVDLTTSYTPSKFLDDYYAGGLCGEDKEGSPVYYELFGTLDMRGIIMSVQRRELITYKLFQHELIKEYLKMLSKEKGKEITNILIVVDMMHCTRETLWGPSLRLWAEIIELLQDNYPKLVKEVLVIHPPPMYAEIYLSLRPYMKPSTTGLIKVLGANFFKYMTQRIPKHNIPAYLGGYKCDFDNNPKCYEDLNWVDQVPNWLYLTSPSIQARALEINILAGERHLEEYLVTLPKSLLSWEFYFITRPVVVAFYINTISHRTCVFRKENMWLESKKRSHSIVLETSGRLLFVVDNCKDHSRNVRVTCNITINPPTVIPLKTYNQPLGDSINFNQPISGEERKLRENMKLKLPYISGSRKASF